MWWSFKPYVSVAERRAKALCEVKMLEKNGQKISPVRLEGKALARTFWGKAWCDNLESYSDYDNRLPRGRSYVRNGAVCDLQIEPGRVTALVCGSELYKIKIAIKPLAPNLWSAIKRQCAGQIGSVIELLQGKLSQHVMQIVTRPGSGLFPKAAEITLNCSCPDWADMCKHVAAALYGVATRLDEQPEFLFVLRKVDPLELISQAGEIKALTGGKQTQKTIAAEALSDVFGIEMDGPAVSSITRPPPASPNRRKPRDTAAACKTAGASKQARKANSTARRKSDRKGKGRPGAITDQLSSPPHGRPRPKCVPR